jgi:hypothetical protein
LKWRFLEYGDAIKENIFAAGWIVGVFYTVLVGWLYAAANGFGNGVLAADQ